MNHVVLILYFANSLRRRIEPTSPAYTPYSTSGSRDVIRKEVD